ncbi:hypothetical protein [Lonsdalea quercina]|uniref:hypothetical protein n=1 Tax=Lonsdalea quercina TaxID=71657 RepID=UPI00047972CF|nr:hypothetical protein [Lonsdalea quercina]
MSIRDHNREMIIKFFEHGDSGDSANALYRFNGEKIRGIENVLDFLGENYKIFGMDRKSVVNNIHAARVSEETVKNI